MSFFHNEFPHTRTYDGDLGYLIKRYRELSDLYDGIEERLKALEDEISGIPAYIQKLVNEIIQAQMKPIREEIEKFDLRIAVMEGKVAQAEKQVEYLTEQVLTLYKMFSEITAFVESYVDIKVDMMYEELRKIVENWAKDIPPVRCPVDGNMEGINTALEHIYRAVGLGITAGQYRELQLTADEYRKKKLTAIAYANRAYFVFFDTLFCSMISPFTGQRTKIADVVRKLAEFHQKGLTAQEYKDLMLTAQEYLDEAVTAYKYVWNSPWRG